MPTDGGPAQCVEHDLTGPVTVYEAAAVRETLRAALAEGRQLRLDLTDSGPWDIAGLQLLISCVKSGRLEGREVRIVNAPSSCTDIAQRYGLSDWLGTVAD